MNVQNIDRNITRNTTSVRPRTITYERLEYWPEYYREYNIYQAKNCYIAQSILMIDILHKVTHTEL